MSQQPAFYITFDVVTEESAAHGEAERRGWAEPGGWEFDDKPETPAYAFDPEGDMDWDEFDSISEAKVAWATKILEDAGATHFCGNDRNPWWSTEAQVEDYSTDERYTYHYHPEGFTEKQMAALIAAVGQ